MKKVIAINSSRRNKNTYELINKVSKILNEYDIDVEIINLYDYNIKECLGCETCLKSDKCIINDDCKMLMHKLKEYDGIILSSPVYMGSITGRLKSFVDRTCKWYHRPELYGKPVLSVSTTAGSDLKYTLNYLETVAVKWGAFPTGKIGRQFSNAHKEVEESECKEFIEYLNMSKERYKPSLNQLINFEIQKILAEKILTIDKEYWIEKKWNDKLYFFDCDISPFNKVVSKMFYKFLSSKIKKVK